MSVYKLRVNFSANNYKSDLLPYVLKTIYLEN